jgi:hypothetical protein
MTSDRLAFWMSEFTTALAGIGGSSAPSFRKNKKSSGFTAYVLLLPFETAT